MRDCNCNAGAGHLTGHITVACKFSKGGMITGTEERGDGNGNGRWTLVLRPEDQRINPDRAELKRKAWLPGVVQVGNI
jgi:hypothetical protein